LANCCSCFVFGESGDWILCEELYYYYATTMWCESLATMLWNNMESGMHKIIQEFFG